MPTPEDGRRPFHRGAGGRPALPDLSLAEKRLLLALPRDGSAVPAAEAASRAGFHEEVEALRAASGPERHGLVAVEEAVERRVGLTAEGLAHKQHGLPERRAVEAIHAAGGRLPMERLAASLERPEVPVAVGWLKRKGWASLEKGDGGTDLVLTDGLPRPGDDEAVLAGLAAEPVPVDRVGHEAGLGMLRQRSGVVAEEERTRRLVRLTEAGQAFVGGLDASGLEGAEEWNELTPERVARWAEMGPDERRRIRLRPFDFGVDVAPRYPGKPHPVTQLMAEIRAVFFGMGFKEIAGDYVESAFWNMDALFIPQDHPARDMQDTFYLAEPATLDVDGTDLERGRAVHERGGGTGSEGWGGAWSPDVARQALLRTHTTNTTVRYLARNPEGPHKVFGLGRVFRNETMDSTHLPEFHQIEGIVTEEGADFDMLVGLCRSFFTRMGFPEVRLRPAYFPYTEPSMEIEVLHGGKWMELGGAGVFRPEVTKPLGVEHPVLAWGFGLERLAMERLGLQDIRDLYVSDVQWLRENPLQ